jgi:maltose alpha-D-glucosyltransferase/alpha-amylase
MNLPSLAAWMAESLPAALPTFLPDRRWFGGKARAIGRVAFEDAAWLPDDRRPSAYVVARVRDTADEESRYALLVAFDSDPGPLPTLGRVDCDGRTAWAFEAASDRSATRALLRGFTSEGDRHLPMLRGGALQYGDADAVAARVLDSAADIRPIGAEQSNTSLRIDGTLACKLFRRLEDGENPEVEVGRFLASRTRFRELPLLRGSLMYVGARDRRATAGVLQDWIEGRGDGWGHVVSVVRQHGESALTSLRDEAFALGAVTERLHRAMATESGDPAFAPEPTTRADVDVWRQNLFDRITRVRRLIEHHIDAWSPHARRLGERFVEHSSDLQVVRRLPDPVQFPFRKIRVHGDYHLGQTLRTASGFVVIDFEGEPARSLPERRAKQPALKDVAGMLRSFDYAVETVATDGDSGAGETTVGITHTLRHGFLDGYRATFAHNPPAFAPGDPAAVSAWTTFFELEKALYEVEYEVNNRPAWVHIPLGGLVRILSGTTDGDAHA